MIEDMNVDANLLGLFQWLSRHRNKDVGGLIECDNGYLLSSREVRAYVRYCVGLGIKNLSDAPSFHSVKEELKIK